MKRGYSCKTDQKHHIKNEQTKFDNYGTHTNGLLQSAPKNQYNKGKHQASQEQKRHKYRDQLAYKIKGDQDSNPLKKNNRNFAKIYDQESNPDLKLIQKNSQQKNIKIQQQLSKKNNIQQLKKHFKQTNNDFINRQSEQDSPSFKKAQSNSPYSMQLIKSPEHNLNSSIILINQCPMSPDEDINQNQQPHSLLHQQFNEKKVLQNKKDDYTNIQVLIRFERYMKQQKEYIQAQHFRERDIIKGQIASLFQSLQHKISSELQQQLKKQTRFTEYKKQLQAQQLRQRSAFMTTISSQLQSQYAKISNQLSALKQTIKQQNRNTINSSQTLLKTEKAEMQKNLQQAKKENGELRAELKRRELFQKQNEDKIRQQYIQMKNRYESEIIEKYESQIRQINDQNYKQIQNYKSLWQQQRRQKEALLKMQNQQQPDIFSSNLLNFSNLQHAKSFIKKQIETFQSKSVSLFELIFQKDHRNSNFGVYMDPPFPFLLLILTQKNHVFGAYSQGFQTYKSRVSSESLAQKQKIKAFLFNVNNKQIFINDRKSSLSAVQYMDNMLRFGNSEVMVKNNNLEIVKVNANNILGECYYTIKYRRYLTGQEGDQIRIKRLQIHHVYFKKE